MKVAYIQDMDPLVSGGGAQLTDRAHINRGLERGHAVQIIVPAQNIEELEDPYDLAVVSNSMSLRPDTYESLKQRGIPYVIFAHDMGPWVCRWRLFYSMEDRCRTICYLRPRWRPILQESALIVWLSPLHRWSWLWAYPELRTHPYALAPSPVDAKRFYAMREPRTGALAINAGIKYKGADAFLKWAEGNPLMRITLAGGKEDDVNLPPNVEFIGYVPQAKLNELYNKHEFFWHCPPTVGPFDRTVAEAYLAGCKLIVNRNVGATSYRAFRKGREAVAKLCGDSPNVFWTAIEKTAGGSQ